MYSLLQEATYILGQLNGNEELIRSWKTLYVVTFTFVYPCALLQQWVASNGRVWWVWHPSLYLGEWVCLGVEEERV